MVKTLVFALLFFISIIVLILMHELGHMLTAKHFGIKVGEFGIGFGKRLWAKEYKGTVYSINLLPFGGFCSFSDPKETDKVKKAVEDKFIYEASSWQRFLVLIAGPMVNIVTGFVLIVCAKGFAPAFTMMGKLVGLTLELPLTLLDIETITGGGFITSSLMTGQYLSQSPELAVVLIGALSVVLGLFNLLPIPGLDGFSAIWALLEVIAHRRFSQALEMKLKYAGFLAFSAIMMIIMISDVWQTPMWFLKQ